MSPKPIRVLLLVEDNPGDARLLREMFDDEGSYKTALTHVGCMADAEKHLASSPVDIIVLDLGLPDAGTGCRAARSCRRAARAHCGGHRSR